MQSRQTCRAMESSASHSNIHISAPLRIQYHDHVGTHDSMPCITLLPRDAGGQGRVQETAPTQREKQKQRRRISSKRQAIHLFGKDQALQYITSSKSHGASPKNRIMKSPSTAYASCRSCSSGSYKHTAADAIDQLVSSGGRWIPRQLRRALWRALKMHLIWANWRCTAAGGPSCSPLINVPEGDVTALWKMLGQGPTRRQQPFRCSGTVVVISFDSRQHPMPSRRIGAGTRRLVTLVSSDPRPCLVLHDAGLSVGVRTAARRKVEGDSVAVLNTPGHG